MKWMIIAIALISTTCSQAAPCSSFCNYVLNVTCGAGYSCALAVTTDTTPPTPVTDIEVVIGATVKLRLAGPGSFIIGFRPNQNKNVFPVFLFKGDTGTPFAKVAQGTSGATIDAKYFLFWWDDATKKQGFCDPKVIVNGGVAFPLRQQ